MKRIFAILMALAMMLSLAGCVTYVKPDDAPTADLTPEECMDAETFLYRGQPIWNGF